MIPLSEINKVAKQHGVPAETIEKDYMICWLLTCFSRCVLKENLVFYGGTAIKRVYFEKYRFSEDIDLISTQTLKQDFIVERLFDAFRYAADEANIHFEALTKEAIYKEGRLQLQIAYSGYDEIIGAPKKIQMDFAMGMQGYGEQHVQGIKKTYSDLNHHCKEMAVQTLNTIFANKIGLLMDGTRNEPRDLYDIWFLLKNRKKIDFDNQKVCNVIKQKYGFLPSMATLTTQLQANVYKERWKYRLEKQVPKLPDVELVLRSIENGLKNIL